jgi:eukaryotic-like serine/threonine-protein kinase
MEFQFGDWLVSPEANIVSNGDAKTQLEPRVMAVLRYLCRHPGAVIPAEEILQACWGSSELGDNPVHKAITQLRRAFGDSSTEPRYIETIRKRGYRAIAPVVTLAAPPPTTWEGGSPFRGLEAFQENHAAIFFGRVQATAQLRELVLTQAAHGCPMALILGPSGSGKTSLVRAGLLPQLMAGAIRSDEPIGLSSTVYLDCADLGSGTLFQALAGALIDAEINGAPLFLGASADSLGQRLASDPEAVATELRERGCPKASVGVFVDRLEAVFRAQSGEADRFLEVVEALAKSNCLLMLMACRNDFYPEVMAQPVLLALKSRGGHYDVLPPDGADIAQIVRQPALAAKLTFEKDDSTGASLDDVLCDAARGNTDMLPLLQYTLNELYRQRSEDGQLSFDVYRLLGGIEGAVGVRAEQVVAQLTTGQIAALPHVLSLLVNVGEDQSSVTSRRSPLSMLRTNDERDLVRVMVEARLFVSELAGDVPSFGVAHEALLRQWPRVAEWIERHRNSLQLRSRISGQAARWADSGRTRDLLLPRGSQVSQACELLSIADFSLTSLDHEYIRASKRRAQFLDRLRLCVTAVIGLLAILTTISALTARSAQRDAERNRSEAEGLMTFMLGDFVEKLRPIGRLDLLDNVGNKALAYLGRSDASEASAPSLVSRIKALRIIAEVNDQRGRKDQYHQTLLTARELVQRAPQQFRKQSDYLKEACAIAFHFAQYYMDRNELAEADKYLGEYRNYADQYAGVSETPADGWLEQSFAHDALGTLAMKRADYKTGASEFSKSLELKRQAASVQKADDKLNNQMAITISWYAESKLKSGDPTAAMELYKEEELLLRSVPASNAGSQSKLTLSLMRQALLSVAIGKKQEAIKALENAETIARSLVEKDSTNLNWQVRLLTTQGRLAEIRLSPTNAKTLLAELQTVCDKLKQLLNADSRNSFLAYQTVKFELGRTPFLIALGRDRDALTNSDDALRELGALLQRSPGDKTLLGFLADGLLTRAELVRKTGDNSAAIADCKRASDLLRDFAATTTEYSLLASYVRANLCTGNGQSVLGQIQKLNSMGYREEKYMQSIATQPLLKGKI